MRRVILCATAVAITHPAPAIGWSMATELDTVRKDAKIIAIGTVTEDKGGLAVDVEYAIRGTASRGLMAVKDSPDGHVWIEPDPKKRKRVVAFIDDQNRLRWVARLIAGPDLENGVILLEGFFDYNAHIVYPGLMTLPQLKSYLKTGKLVQVFRATLAFPDGKGGLRASSQIFEVEYDAIARTTLGVSGLKMACLEHPQLSSASWGRFSLFFHCRKRIRTLSLAGEFTGVERSTGKILVRAAPLRPFLYEGEFATYTQDPLATAVDRVIEVKLSNGRVWKWRVDHWIAGPGKRSYKPRGQSVGSTRTGSKTTTYRRYRFGRVALKITYATRFPGWASDAFSLVQLVDAKGAARCVFEHAGKSHDCRLRHATPVWTRAGKKK